MTAKTFDACKTAADFCKLAERKGGQVHNTASSHRKIKTDRGAVVIPCHGDKKEICRQLRCKIVKQLALIGLAALVVAAVVGLI